MGTEHSGKFAVVDGQTTVRNWTISEVQAAAVFVASNTDGGTGRRRGVKDWSGGFSQYGGTPLNMPGESLTFKGFTAPDDDVSGAGKTYEGTAIIDQIVVNWNWETGGIISTDYTFSGNGLLSKSTDTVVDSTAPDVPETCGTILETAIVYVATVPTFVELAKLVSATLTITSANQTFVNSSTANGVQRKAGVIDWAVSIVSQDLDAITGANLETEDLGLRMYINATEFWFLTFGVITGQEGITADREGGAMLSQTLNIAMNADDTTENTGEIILPGAGSAWWP